MSPVLHKAALAYHGLNKDFSAWDIKPDELYDFVNEARKVKNDISGFSVTVPHKETIIPMLDGVSIEAEAAGAVNMVCNQDGHLYGYNTDGLGFLRSIREKAEFDLKGKKVLVLGAGGAARGVISAIRNQNVDSVAIANRTVGRAAKLFLELELGHILTKVVPMGSLEMNNIASESDLIVQCTTVGMLGGSEPNKSLIKANNISDKSLVYDLVYNPENTPLLIEAKKAGARIMSGMWMLVYQGAVAFEKWTSREAPIEVMFQATQMSGKA
jgi:shikimate dehydrogenase